MKNEVVCTLCSARLCNANHASHIRLRARLSGSSIFFFLFLLFFALLWGNSAITGIEGKKRQQQREKARQCYQNHREAILEERRKRYSRKCTSGPFPNSMSEKRALDEVKSALPESAEKKVYIVAKLV